MSIVLDIPNLINCRNNSKIMVAIILSLVILNTLVFAFDQTVKAQSIVSSTEASSQKIFCLGDSITYGYDPNNPDHRLSSPYPASLMVLTQISTINGGVNGATTSDMLPDSNSTWKDQGLTTLVLMGGINDILNGSSASSIKNNLLLLWQIALGDNMDVYALTILPYKQLNSAQNTILASVNSWIKTTAPTYSVTVVDTHTLLEDSANSTVLDPTYDSGDGLHPNQAGANIIANAVYQAIQRNEVHVESSLILTNEEGCGISALINANYGSSNIYQALLAIISNADPSISSIITTSFMDTLSSCPTSSQIFTSKLEDYNSSAGIAINTDGTIQTVNINGSTYLRTQETSNLNTTISGAGTFVVDYNSSSSPITSWNVTSSSGTTIYNTYTILWMPMATNTNNTQTTTPTTTNNPTDYNQPIIIVGIIATITILVIVLSLRKLKKDN